MSIFLPDNRLLRLLAERTGDSASIRSCGINRWITTAWPRSPA